MNDSKLRIDPRLPICWEDFDTLRIGFEVAAVRFDRPSAATQRIVAGFRRGLPIAPGTARRLGAAGPEWKRVVGMLAPVLVEREPTEGDAGRSDDSGRCPPERLVVSGTSGMADALRAMLRQSGFEVAASLASDAPEADPTMLVIVQQFLEPMSPEQLCIAERVPQLLVRFTDRSAWIGPLVPPLGSPCGECAALHDIGADPALTVLATQLLGYEPEQANPRAVLIAAALVSAAVEQLSTGGAELRHGRLRVPTDGEKLFPAPEFHPLSPHPECRCADQVRAWGHPGIGTPASATNRDGARWAREPPAAPEMRSVSRARVSAT